MVKSSEPAPVMSSTTCQSAADAVNPQLAALLHQDDVKLTPPGVEEVRYR